MRMQEGCLLHHMLYGLVQACRAALGHILALSLSVSLFFFEVTKTSVASSGSPERIASTDFWTGRLNQKAPAECAEPRQLVLTGADGGAHTIWSPSNSAQRKRNTKILGKGELIACLVILLFWGMETVITRHQSSQLEVLIITAAHKREERREQSHYFVQIY